ncbi:fibronectin type III domain-containing protein [Streptomyces sp. NPDC047315]|uniref:fibronectin type III domain-containing protein n=1 Tax=Streptomyces sp. NPDC047315 TaxID=3155142 RepID=UPI0034070FF8
MHRPPTLVALACAAVLLPVTLTACGGDDGKGKKDTEPPTTPAGVTAQAGSATSVHVMWKPATDDEAVTGYQVLQQGREVKSLPGSTTMVDVDGLKPGTAYAFTVRARDAAGNVSGPSTAVSVTTPAAKPEDKKAPTTPTGLRGTVDREREVSLSWRPATDDARVTSYDVYQEDTRIHSVAGTETTARVPHLRPGTVYTFTVRARDAAENSSSDSNAVDLTTPAAPGAGPNTAPTDLTATATKGSIELTWTPPKTDGVVKSHELYLNGKMATTIVWGGEPPAGGASYTMTISDPPGTRYSVKLRAKLPDGKWGDFSAQRTVVTR